MMMCNALRRGFTLVEMLVTLILLGILVAIVFPVVTQQIEDADPTKAANDLANIRVGIEIFHLNVRPTYPGHLEHLANPISTADESLNRTGTNPTFTPGQVPRWNGPYIDKAVPGGLGTGDALLTGFGGNIRNELIQYDATSNCPFGGSGGGCPYVATNQTFVAVMVHGLSSDEASKIDALMDGGDGLDQGQIRFNSLGSSDVLYFLAVPLR